MTFLVGESVSCVLFFSLIIFKLHFIIQKEKKTNMFKDLKERKQKENRARTEEQIYNLTQYLE